MESTLWIKSYLENRYQFVKFGSGESNNFVVTSDVLQGSHLSSTLFLLFINDIADQMPPGLTLLFADYVKIAKIKSSEDKILFEQTINKLREWCDKNLDKCFVLALYRGCELPIREYKIGEFILNWAATWA